MPTENLSLYIHYPFCKSKCPYCDFNSHVFEKIENEKFLQGYLRELEFFAAQLPKRKIKTIFFGGGTPSLMPINLVEKILEKIATFWEVDKSCEITLEANPTSFESTKFKDFKSAGINRLSIGIQALNDADLKFLGREHNALEAIKTIKTAGKIFENYSFDLIYARPNQSLESWKNELSEAINLSANHLSLYQLTIEKGTKFYGKYKKGEFILPDEDLAAEFYEITNSITSNHGLELYEISNYAKKDFECKHNLVYWQSEDYLGIGAGAHSRLYLNNDNNKSSIIMISEPTSWLKKNEELGAGIQNQLEIKKEELLEEVILMGLRLKEGIQNEIFLRHFNKNIAEIFDFQKLAPLIDEKLIFVDEKHIKITNNGRLLTNIIIQKISRACFQT